MNDCTNAYCPLRIGQPPKQHTNGPCKCLQDVPAELRVRITRKLFSDRQALKAWRGWADDLLAVYIESCGCREEVSNAVGDLLDRRPDREE